MYQDWSFSAKSSYCLNSWNYHIRKSALTNNQAYKKFADWDNHGYVDPE